MLFLFAFQIICFILLVACQDNRTTLPVEPSITLNPQFGGANTQVIVSGSGFPAETAITIRLGPPDVGATPQTYGSAVVQVDNRFSLTFTIPNNWPDGQPISETELLVIALNEDGSLKATAPFQFQIGQSTNPPETIHPYDPILISNEEAIVTAVKNHLVQTGGSSHIAVSVEQIEGEFARVGIFDLMPDSAGMSIGFLKSVNSIWEVIVIGRNFDSDQLLELGLPQSILPEAILLPDG